MNLERMEELLFYRNLLETDFVQDLKADAPYASLSRLFQNYSTMPKETNLWHIFLADFLLQDENSLSLSAEKKDGSISLILNLFKEKWKFSILSTI